MNTQDIPIPASARHMFAGRNLAPTREEAPVLDNAWALALDPQTESEETLRTGAAAIMQSLGVTNLDGRVFSGGAQKALTGREYYAYAMQTLRDGYFRPSPEWEEFAAAEEAGDRKKMRALAKERIKGEGVGHDAGELVDKYDQSSLADIDKKLDAVRDAMTPEDIAILDAERETDERLNEILAAEEGSWYEGGEEAFGSRPPDREKEDAMRRQAAMDERRFAAHAALYRKYHDAIEDEGRLKRYKAQLEDENLWAVVKSLDGHITDGAQRVLDMALKSGDDPTNRIVMNAFERLSTPEQRSIAGVLQALHYGRDKNFATFLGDLGRSFADTLGMVTVGAVRGAADMVRRTYMDSAEYRDMVERRTLLEDANRERMLDWGYLGDSVIGVASTIPYMAAAAIPYVGMADMILSAKDQFQSEASRNGVDVASWDFQVGSAAFATAYAFVERIQWDKAFGGISSVSRRQMYCDAFHSLNKALRVGGAVAGTMLTESGEEGIQRALEEVANHWGLGTDQLKNAVSGFVEDFVGSLGTMAIIGGVGAVKQGIAYRHGAIGFDTAEAAALNSRIEQVNSHFTGEGRDIKPLQSFGREFGRMAEDWLNAGNLGRARKRTLQRWGLTSEQADTVNASLQTLWSNIERTDAASGERSRLESAFVGGSRVLTPAEVVAKIQNGTWRGKVETDENGNQSTDITVRGVKLRMTISPNRDKPAVDVNNPAQYESIVGALNARSGRNLTVERFAGMDEKERRDLVEGLVDNGHTTFTAPDGTKIAGRVLDAIAGRMDLTDAALPQTAWHETMHGVLSILSSAAAGEKNEDESWRVKPDPEARKLVDALVANGYAPQSARESVDEERLSDAFQRYMTGRVSVVEADGILDRLGRFVARTFGYGDRGGPEIKRARTAQERLFNTAITGHIKNAMEQAGGEEAPRSEAAAPGANPATTTPPPDEAEEVLRRAEEAGGDVSAVATAFRNGDPLDAERMAALAANGLTTHMAWDHGYRWNETDGEWQFDEKLARPVDKRDLPQTAYMGVDGKMHQPAGPSSGERHQITSNPDIRYSIVTDQSRISAWEDEVARGDYYVTYRAVERVAMPDGTEALVPPMNGYDPETKSYIDPVHEGDWIQADVDEAGIVEDGNPDYAHYEINYRVQNQATGKWKTQKTRVAFNPYVHSSFNPFNDQFKAAYNRPNMVVVRMLVPKSAAEGEKSHPRAKNKPGLAEWKAGSVASQLKTLGKPERKVMLSTAAKVDKVLSYAEVADLFDEMSDGVKDRLSIPEEVMPPGLRDVMQARGYRIEPMQARHSVSPEFAQDGTVVDALPAHLREDGRRIVAERANTPEWMTDPDGTPTDLSERDWLRREAETRHSISGIYTGTAADYDAPSLHYVGTGEGTQVYGWGLYGSNVRGVAESYAMEPQTNPEILDSENRSAFDPTGDAVADEARKALASMYIAGAESVDKAVGMALARLREKGEAKSADWLKEHSSEFHVGKRRNANVYEQTFFTNREPGDERHLLKWYEPVSEEQRKWIRDAIRDMYFANEFEEGGAFPERRDVGNTMGDLSDLLADGKPVGMGETLYHEIATILGSPRAASEFLARAGIDGIKYPVDSYGTTVKDGDKVGWNYVSFRDDNIRVDHKWVDGVQRYSITPAEDAAYLDAVQRGDAKAVEQLERKAAALAMPNTKVVGRDGLPLVVFHGTASKERFNKFKDGAIFTFHREDLAGQYTNKRRDLWVSPQQTGRVMPLFVNLENPLEIDAKRRLWNNLRVEWSEEPVSTDEILVYAKEHGHDGVIIRNVRDNMFNDERTAGNEYIAFDSSQVKSTGATYEMRDVGWGMKGEKIASMFGPTYDDAGNVIPLSRRFNPANEDIRYQITPGESRFAQEIVAAIDSIGNDEFEKIFHGTKDAFLRSKTGVMFSDVGEKNGAYDAETDTIYVSIRHRRNVDEIAKTIKHELVHVRQVREGENVPAGFDPSGTSMDALKYLADPGELEAKYAEEGRIGEFEGVREKLTETLSDSLADVEIGETKLADWNRTRLSESGLRQLQRQARNDDVTAGMLERSGVSLGERLLPAKMEDVLSRISEDEAFYHTGTAIGYPFENPSAYVRDVVPNGRIRVEVIGRVDESTGKRIGINPVSIAESLKAKGISASAVGPNEINIFATEETKRNLADAFKSLSRALPENADSRRHQIIGQSGAESLGLRGLADAEAMERSGADRLAVWRETGWWRGKDGEWRVEIPDFELNADAPRMLLANGTARLSDLIPAESAILRAYPSLGKMRINMVDSQSFSGRNNGISIDIDRGELSSPDKLRSTLAHEIQHSLQTIEGFARGGSWDEQVAGRDANALRRLTRERNTLKRILAAIEDQQPPSLYEFQMQRLGVSWNYSVVRNALDEKNREIREMRKSGVRSTIGKTGYNNLAGEAEARLVEKRLGMTPEERAARPPWEDFDVAESEQIVRERVAQTNRVKAPSAAAGVTRFSVQSGLTAAGFTFERVEDGPFRVFAPDGTQITKKRRVTADDILKQDTMLTHLIDLGIKHKTISKKAARRFGETFATCFNLVADWGSTEDGLAVVDATWKLAGDIAFKALKSNSDKQYLSSVDILTICKKVDMVVQVMSDYMVRTGRGVMPTDVMALYKATGEMGFQTPCPVCYVFSRWIRGGYDRQTIAEGQRLFAGEVRAHDPNTDEGKKYWRARYEELFVPAKKEDFSSDPAVRERQKARVAEISDAKASLNLGYQTFDSFMLSAQKAREAGDEEAAARFEEMADDVNERIRAAFDAVRTSDLAGYIKYCIFDPDTGRVWKDFAVAPDDVVFDLRAAGEIARHYPGIKRFIKSKGSAGGKAIETEAENDVGDIVSGIASDGKLEAYELWSEEYERDLLERSQERDPETNKKTAAANAAAAKYNARNWLKVAYALPAGSKERKEALKKFDAQFKTALAKSARQRLRGGQRFFSWSDNRTEFGFDMMMNLAQIQMLGDSIQSYSKQLEGAELLAAHGAYNNGSLMASGGGLEDAKPGEEGATKIGGRWVKLKFSDVQGIAHKPLFELNKKYDKSGNILVGMNDDHIVAALRDKRIFFVIPWHASGLGRELLDYMLEILKEPAAGSETDYSPVQEDKWLKPKQVDAELVAGVWDRAKAGAKKLKSCFPVSHEAGKITQSQERYRDLRGRIMSGKDLTQADIDLALKDEFLSQLVRSLAAAAEQIGGESAGATYVSSGLKDAAGKPISLLKMTKDDVGAIYPYEYWDKKTTYGTSAVNSARYLEYCRRLGVLPKFCGIVASDKGSRRLTDKSGKPYGDFTAEPMYWQLLVDRRMYANGRNADGSWKDFDSGKYQDTDQVEAVTDARPFNVDLIDPNKVEKKWGKLITKKAEPKAVGRIVDTVLEKQRSEGYSLASSDSGERHSIVTDPAWDDAEGQADAAVREADSLERSSISWDGPAFSYRSFAEAFAARDMALGFDRPREQYQQLIESLGISDEVSVDDILSEASRLKSDVRAASDSIAALAGRAEERKFARTVRSLVEGAHEVGVEVGGNARRAWEKYISQMRRMAKGRDYEDFYSDMRIDFARLLLSFSADEFDERRKPEGDEGETAPAASEEDEEALRAFLDADEGMDGVDLNDLRQRVMDRMERRMGEIRGLRERIIARLDEWRAAEEERRRKAEEREGANPPKENDETESDFDEGGEDTEGGAKRLEDYENESVEQLPDFKEFVEGLKADGLDLSNAGEFAAAIRFYVEDWLSRETGADPKDVLKDPVNAARYRRTVVDILRSLCTQLLDPADGKASIVAERMLAEIPGDASPAEVQGRTRAIVAFVQRNAVRQSAKKLIKDLRKTIKQLAISGKRFDETEKDLGRKITGEREQYARYLYRILDWSDGRIAKEEQKLNDIISGRRTAYEAARGTDAGLDALAQTDREIHRAVERLDALRLWGGLRRKMPGEIALAAQQIKSWLETERDAHERRWAAWKESLDAEADALVAAFSADSKDYTPDDPGVVGRLGDELTTNFRMRLERLAVGSGAEGRRAIDAVMRRIYEGSERLQNVKAVQRARFDALLARCVQGTGMTESDFLKSLDEPIPEELNRRLVTAEQPTRMTWGQALQLLGQLEQTASYQRNIDANGRGAFDAEGNEQTPHRDLIVRALQDKPQMLRLLDELRAVYDENRTALSDAFAAVTGNPILQPDPLYLPARMYLGANDNLETTVRAWNPFGPAFSPRVRNTADFDLSVSILDIFAERQRETAVALAFGVRGMELRSILARKEVQDAIARTHGKYALRKMVAQLTDIVGDGYKGASGQSDGYRGLVQAIGNFTTYTALSWNVVTMLKQMTSIPSWTAILDGGYAEIFRHICNFDRDAARELVEAPGFVARYGATGFADMIRQEMRNPQGGNLVARLARAGMTLVQIGDFVPGILVGTGVYKARKLALMGEGLSEAAARKQAATETWGLIEENQQSSRLENTPEFLRRGGFLARQLSKFATSPMMQVAHEIHTCRMWLAEKKAAKNRGEDESEEAKRWRRKFVNQIVCNHILMPASFYAVSQLFGMALGDEPPDDDELVGDLIMQMVSGPFSRIFLVGMLADKTGEWAARIVGGKPNVSRSDGMAAQQQLAKVLTQTGRIGADIADLDWESVRDDFVKMIGQVNAPFRYATKLTQNVAGYDPAKARRERKARIKKERGGD